MIITKNASYTYFDISGNFNTKQILELLEIEPIEKWDIGNPGKYIEKHNIASIKLVESKRKTLILEEQVEEVLEVLNPKIEVLQKIRKTFDVKYVLQIVGIPNNDDLPSVSFGEDAIKFCYLTNTIIDCDLYN